MEKFLSFQILSCFNLFSKNNDNKPNVFFFPILAVFYFTVNIPQVLHETVENNPITTKNFPSTIHILTLSPLPSNFFYRNQFDGLQSPSIKEILQNLQSPSIKQLPSKSLNRENFIGHSFFNKELMKPPHKSRNQIV